MRADGEGGLLFYIILGLVALIVSYLQNKAKPKTPDYTEIPQDEPRDIWKELIDWDEEEYRDEKPEKKTEPIKTIPEYSSIEGPIQMDAAHEGLSAMTAMGSTENFEYRSVENVTTYYTDLIKDTEISDVADESESSANFSFNLRDAVIYSEILNRKY